MAAMFETRDQALAFLDRLIEYLNDLESRKHEIEPDHSFYKRIPAMDVFKLLPRTNCRECGFGTCLAFAAAVSRGESGLDRCPATMTLTLEEI